MSEFGREMGWDDEIQHDSEFEVLPAGDYNFKIMNFQRGRHAGSEKLEPCNKAILTIKLWNGDRSTTIEHNLFLHTKCEGLLCEFFTSIGQRKHGDKIKPNWNEVIGSTGTCKVTVRKWEGRDGDMRESNDIRRFYEKGHVIEQMPQASAAPQTNYKAGSF